MQKKPKIFISYNQKSGSKIADKIQNSLSEITEIYRDKKSIPDWGSIKNFMNTIRDQDFVVMIITKEYLESLNSMYEAVQLMKNNNWNENCMFIIDDNAKSIYNKLNWDKPYKYWKEKENELRNIIEKIDCADSKEFIEELQKVREIKQTITSFLKKVSDANNPDNVDEAIEKIYNKIKNSDVHYKDSLASNDGKRQIIIYKFFLNICMKKAYLLRRSVIELLSIMNNDIIK